MIPESGTAAAHHMLLGQMWRSNSINSNVSDISIISILWLRLRICVERVKNESDGILIDHNAPKDTW